MGHEIKIFHPPAIHWMSALMMDSPGSSFEAKTQRAIRRDRNRYHKNRAIERVIAEDGLSHNSRLLRGYLGWKWDDVHADLCQRFASPFFRASVMDSVLWLTKTKIKLVRERPHCEPRGGELLDSFYVCPRTDRLKRTGDSEGYGSKHNKRREDKRKQADNGDRLRRLGGRWFLVDFSPLPEFESWVGLRDVVLGVNLTEADRCHCVPQLLQSAHGIKDVYAQAMRPLTPHERFEHGLTEDAPRGPGHSPYRHMEQRRQEQLRRH